MAVNSALLQAIQGGLARESAKKQRRAESLAALASLGGAAVGGLAGGLAGEQFDPANLATGLGVGQAAGQTFGGLAAGPYGHAAALQGAQNVPLGFKPLLDKAAEHRKAQTLAELERAKQTGEQERTLAELAGQSLYYDASNASAGPQQPIDLSALAAKNPAAWAGFQKARIESIKGQKAAKEVYDPYKTAGIESGITADIEKATAKYRGSVDKYLQFDALVRARGGFDKMTGPDAIAAVKSFEQTLEPTSIVREAEAANIANAAPVADAWERVKQLMTVGTPLTPEQIQLMYNTVYNVAQLADKLATAEALKFKPQIESYAQGPIQLQPANVRLYEPRVGNKFVGAIAELK